MKILMIGGTGTISYDATKYFLAQNHDVYLLNRGNRNNLSDKRLNYIIGNANDAKSLESALDGKEFDVILDFILYNVNQMKERLAIYNNKCKQFIFISSATAWEETISLCRMRPRRRCGICACSCLNMYTGIRSQKARK